MKLIVLAKLSKRMLGKLFDFLLVTILTSLVFFFGVYPSTFDRETYIANQEKIAQRCEESELYLRSTKGTMVSKAGFSAVNTLEELTSINLKVDGEEFKNVNITQSLVNFYTTKLKLYDYEANLSFDVFKKDILKINDPHSNIKDLVFENGNYTYTLMNDKLEYETVIYVLDTFNNAINIVETSKYPLELTNENFRLMRDSLVLFIPIFIGFSFIFDLLIPLFMKNGESLGKLMTKSCLLTKDGYQIKKYQIVVRWFAYLIYDIALSFFTCLGAILISYTMLMFNKKKRTVADYIAGTVVADRPNSVWFKNKEDEEKYKERCKRFSI